MHHQRKNGKVDTFGFVIDSEYPDGISRFFFIAGPAWVRMLSVCMGMCYMKSRNIGTCRQKEKFVKQHCFPQTRTT